MSEWAEVRLGDVATVYDGPHATPNKTECGPWYLSISSLHNGRFELAESAHLAESDLAAWTRRVAPTPGDTLFSYETRIGEAAHWGVDVPAALGRRMGLLRPNRDHVDARFLTYAYLGPQFQEVIRMRTVHGATVERLLIADMPNWPLALPSLDEQRRIAAVLGALDDLIDTERALARSADELWHAVVDTYPGERQGVPLSSLAEFVNGRNFTKGASGQGLPVIRTPELRRGPGETTVRNEADASPDNLAGPGDVLFVWSGSLLVGRWYWARGLINQHIFKVIPRDGVPQWLCHWAIEQVMDDFLGTAADKATTMGHIKRADLDRAVLVPIQSDWGDLNELVRPLWDEVLAARVHANSLVAARGELLPLLMSGRVRVREVS